ncbi:MlaD family protein [Histidinibacterium aquaticum]|uniref:MlaD family protein n=1 Tax=Histidinibacterium aquaticum TaxID=2613962 RepID=UPI00168B1C81|nr:MlaD family protein [Histidinibacterium aquaticum]
MSDAPDVPTEEREGLLDRISIVWAIPVIALAVALFAAWRNYAERGPVIDIHFANAAGVTADETELRYRDIGVGLVEEVGFSEDLTDVIVSVRVEGELAPYIDDGARFWVVRPEVTARGVTGLDTVLSGVYIQGAWDGEIGASQTEFEGLEAPPLLGAEQNGVEFVLRSDSGLPTADSPILFKGVEVGQVDAPSVSEDGTAVEAEAVIYEPYDRLVTTSTRFWDTSGFSFSLGASGARLNFDTIASLISGGVTFETLGSGGSALEDGAVYELFESEEAAREDFLVEGEGEAVNLSLVFDENLAGLSAGAPVELGGLRVGDVASISGIVDEERFGDAEVRLVAAVRINPGRIGLSSGAGEEELLDYLEGRVEDGLRARLTNASLITGGLKVELVELPGAEPAELDRDAEPYPRLPTADPDVTDVQATAQGVLQRVNELPIEELLDNAVGFLEQATALVASEDLQNTPTELRGTLAALRGVAESDGVQQLPDQITEVMTQVQEATDRVNTLLAELEEREAAAALTEAIESVGEAADSLPPVVERAESVLAQAEDLQLEELVAQASSLLASAEEILAQEATRALTAQVNASLAELRRTLASVRGIATSESVQSIPGEVSGLLTDLRGTNAQISGLLTELEEQEAVANITAAVDSIRTAADSLPGLVDEAEALLAQARDLPLDDLVTRATALIDSAEALLAQEATRAIPEQVTASLSELRETVASVRGIATSESVQQIPGEVSALVADLRTASGQLNAILAEVEEQGTVATFTGAVDSIGATADTLPGLVAQAESLLAQAEELPLDELVTRATALIDSAEALLAQDATRAIPAQVTASLAELRDTVASIRGIATSEEVQALPGQVSTLATDLQASAARLDGLLARIEDEDAVGDLIAAIENIGETADSLPGLVEQARSLLGEAEELPLEALVARTTELLDAAEAVLDQESARQVPAELNAALTELRTTLQELREGGLVENTNATLAAARQAADAIAEASQSLPALSAQLQQAATQADTTLAGFSRDSEFSRDLRQAIRQVDEAAASIESLARQIERNPNSIILGR